LLYYCYIGNSMTNNLALFLTHHVFLTDVEMSKALVGEKFSVVGHCVPVWVEAKTGKTTEPAKEVFCWYELDGVAEGAGEIEESRGGFRIALPRSSGWAPPEAIDFEKMAIWTSEMREDFLKKRDLWWFNNPKPPDYQDLLGGYLRFDVKKYNAKIERRKCSIQHVVEIVSAKNLAGSMVL